jgi:hypothetical protein
MFLFRLIGLPFVLLGSLLGLLGLSSRILLMPLRLIVRNPLLALAAIGGLAIYLTFAGGSGTVKPSTSLAPLQGDKQAPDLPKGAVPIIEKASKFEDGNSSFATDLYKTMTDLERQQYSRLFYAVMSRVADGKAHAWNYYNIHGTLTPLSTFKNNSGVTCRTFKEVLKVHRVQQTISGTACQNGGGTWCKLKVNATPACGLSGGSSGIFDSFSNSLQNLF